MAQYSLRYHVLYRPLHLLVPLLGINPHSLIHNLIRIFSLGASIQDFQIPPIIPSPRPVPSVAPKDIPRIPRHACRDDEEREDGPVAHAVHGALVSRKEEGGGDAATVGHGDHAARGEGRGRGALDGRGSVGDEGEDGGVGACDDADGEVADAPVSHDGEEEISCAYKDQGADDVSRPLPRPVTVETGADNDNHGHDIRRHSQQLRIMSLEAERSDNGRRKVAKRVEGVCHEEVLRGEEPEERVGDGVLGDARVPVLVGHGGGKGPETLDGKGTLLGGEPGGRLGVVGEHEPDEDADEDGGDALEDEEPLPAREPGLAVEEADARGEKAAKRARDGDGRGKDGHPGRALLGLVPEAQVHHNTREEAGLGEPEKHTAGEQAPVGGDGGGADGDDAPGDHDAGDPAAGGEVLEQDVGGELHEDVGDEKEGHGDIVALAGEVELGDDVVLWGVIVEGAGVAEVDSVEVVWGC